MITRRLILMGAVFVSLFVSLFVTAPTAEAAPSCKDTIGLLGGVPGMIYSGVADPGMAAPTPAMPGRGAPALFDGKPSKLPGNSIYARHGYAGLSWSTYDTGCLGQAGDPTRTVDTYLGNMALGTAVTLVGALDGIHNFAGSAGVGSVLDPITARLSQGVSGALWHPWIGLSLLVLGLGVLVGARKGSLPQVAGTVGWALMVMTLAAGVLAYPTAASSTARTLISSTVGTVNQTLLGERPTQANPGGARADMIVTSVLYPAWLRGELGESSGPTVDRYGRRLFDDQAYDWSDIGHTAGKATSDRQADFKKAAAAVKDSDPAAYANLTGQAGGRLGSGLTALAGVILVGLFPLVADVLVLAALVIIALLCIVFPVLALVGMHPRMSGVVKSALNMAGAALINSVIFSVGAAIALRVAGLVFTVSAIPQWAALVICGVVCGVLWVMLRPFRRLTTMVGGHYNPGAELGGAFGGVRRVAGRIVSTAIGSKIGAERGTREALEEQDQASTEPDQVPESYQRPDMPAPTWRPSTPPEAATVTRTATARPHGAGPQRAALAPGSTKPAPEPTPVPESSPGGAGGRTEGRPEWAANSSDDADVIDAAPTDDGSMVWRVWNPATQQVEVIQREHS